VFFDDVRLIAVQPFCPETKPTPPKPQRQRCVDFTGVRAETQFPPSFVRDQFTFTAMDGAPQVILPTGPPAGQPKLQIHPKGLEVELPFAADEVEVTTSCPSPEPVVVSAYGKTGALVDRVTSPGATPLEVTKVTGSGIWKVTVTGPRRAFLVKICARPDAAQDAGAPPSPGRG
jgi:hypothetical protein